jgi:2-methylcitrate dehydratase
MYILAVALEDGVWHHVRSYAPERAQRPSTVKLWHKITTAEDKAWTERYHHPDPNQRAFGGRVEIHMKDGSVITDEMAVANAHPLGARPVARRDYIRKFQTLSSEMITSEEGKRFLELAQSLPELKSPDIKKLTVQAVQSRLLHRERDTRGIF